MSELQGLPQFANVKQIISLSMTLSHGITPSQAVLRILPQAANINKFGELICTFGPVRFAWIDALADYAQFEFNSAGRVVGITILDRRWKWAYPVISGHYNVRDRTGEIFKDKGTEKAPKKDFAVSDSTRTPKELIELCLKALGETGYELDALPDDIKMEVHWERENAAQALQQVCNAVGCRVVLQLNNKVAIRKIGRGRDVPVGLVEDYSAQLDPPDKPSKLKVVCGPTWYQVDLELEAVGMERDGTVEKIDDLEYKPSGGWKNVAPELMDEVDSDQDNALARTWVFRGYRVKLPVKVKGYKDSPLKFMKQIQLMDEQVYTKKVLDRVQNRQAIVWGEWFDEDAGEASEDKLSDANEYLLARTVVPHSFSVDHENGLILFTRPVFIADDNGENLRPAKLKLRTAIQIRDAKTASWVRHDKELNFDPKAKTEPRELVVPELRLEYAAGKERNRAEIDKELQKRIDVMKADYEFKTPEFVRYIGWYPIELDGAIQSVTWTLDGSGAKTTVQRNDDNGSDTTLPYRVRRLNEAYIAGLNKVARMDPQNKIGDADQEAWRERLPFKGTC